MSHTLNSLTAQLLAGQISCGAYAEAVHAHLHGASADRQAPYVNPMAAAFDADCAARSIDTALAQDDDDDDDAETSYCNDCYRTFDIDELIFDHSQDLLYCERCTDAHDEFMATVDVDVDDALADDDE